ncbi:hypothetical protein CA2559_06925 [Croceibacter atlanticus HTCC2559]|uniref:Uncharacterized protein n=1 Tax=Croceibacter atlanticus (strain ATCC BAA-628 / JCM 21780 / CIP 108009 / IAM 15332 / KCTC 12090 / HTCC2559) TaxID=216432 RepID=A3U8A7_CROAH|nr:hypothetical protein CA2559_06925 [Croceibacter atlanticus HTCC2559]
MPPLPRTVLVALFYAIEFTNLVNTSLCFSKSKFGDKDARTI